MRKTNEEMMRDMAKVVAARAILADTVGSIVYNISKYGKRRLSPNEIWSIERLDENDEDIIPIDVLRFLKRKVKIAKFIDMVREEILIKLSSEEQVSTNQIVRYSTFFNLKNLKAVDMKNSSLIKLLLVICLEEEGIFYDVEEVDADQIDRIYTDLYLAPEKEDRRYIRAVENAARFLR